MDTDNLSTACAYAGFGIISSPVESSFGLSTSQGLVGRTPTYAEANVSSSATRDSVDCGMGRTGDESSFIVRIRHRRFSRKASPEGVADVDFGPRGTRRRSLHHMNGARDRCPR
jgi:hypothetical protein